MQATAGSAGKRNEARKIPRGVSFSWRAAEKRKRGENHCDARRTQGGEARSAGVLMRKPVKSTPFAGRPHHRSLPSFLGGGHLANLQDQE